MFFTDEHAFVPHQAHSTLYCTCLDELGGEGKEPLERRCRKLRLLFPIYLAADSTKPHSESQDQAECFQRIRKKGTRGGNQRPSLCPVLAVPVRWGAGSAKASTCLHFFEPAEAQRQQQRAQTQGIPPHARATFIEQVKKKSYFDPCS